MSIPGIPGLVGNDAGGIYRLAAADNHDGAEDVGSYANRRGSHYRGGYTAPSTNLQLQPDGPWCNGYRGLQYEVQLRDSQAFSNPFTEFSIQSTS